MATASMQRKLLEGGMVRNRVVEARDEAERKAWDSLGRYKFEMFGYWASAWVKYNQLLKGTELHDGNPFKDLVSLAREHQS